MKLDSLALLGILILPFAGCIDQSGAELAQSVLGSGCEVLASWGDCTDEGGLRLANFSARDDVALFVGPRVTILNGSFQEGSLEIHLVDCPCVVQLERLDISVSRGPAIYLTHLDPVGTEAHLFVHDVRISGVGVGLATHNIRDVQISQVVGICSDASGQPVQLAGTGTVHVQSYRVEGCGVGLLVEGPVVELIEDSEFRHNRVGLVVTSAVNKLSVANELRLYENELGAWWNNSILEGWGWDVRDNGPASAPLFRGLPAGGLMISSGSHRVHNSAFVGNEPIAVELLFADPLPVFQDFSDNWWGSSLGPSPADSPIGAPVLGDQYEPGILVTPHLASAPN